MATLLNACLIAAGVANTGFECSKSLSVPLGLFLVPPNAKWTKADMADPYEFFQTKIHAVKSARFFPVFADLKNFEVADGSDQSETYANGDTSMLHLGGFNMTLTFKKGGECLAKKLLSFNKKGYRFVVVDDLNQFKMRKNADGTFSGLKAIDIYAMRPELATFTASYKNKVMISVSLDEWIKNSEVFATDVDLSDVLGLLDVDVVSLAAPTATKVTVGASSECAGTDLYALYADPLAVPGAWSVKDNTGAALVPTAVAKNAALGGWDLTFASQLGKTLTVNLVDATALAALNVTGYEGASPAVIVMPTA